MNKISVLIIDDNHDYCDILCDYFALTDKIEIRAVAHDGATGLELIYKYNPDVVLLDIIMPELDGIAVLEELKKTPAGIHSRIIVISAIGQENVTANAIALGADYYIMKPFTLEVLQNRIMMLTLMPEQKNARDITPEVTKIIMGLGIPANVLGFKYIIESLKIILTSNNTFPISKEVYSHIAENNHTTVECIESAIRKTITKLYETDSRMLTELIGSQRKPSNSKFLTTLAEKIKLESCEDYVSEYHKQ